VFALTSNFWLLLLAATVGVISPTGNEVGPFLSIEQAALAQTVPGERRTHIFAWYNLVGSVATAAGALCGGALPQLMQALDATGADTYRPLAVVYALVGGFLALAFTRLSAAAEHGPVENRPHRPDVAVPSKGAWANRWGLGSSLAVVLKLAGLFALDAFGG